MAVKREVAFMAQYFRMNLAATMEYRFSFFSQVVGMFLNNGMWLLFWKFYFERFPVLNGWQIEDVVVLWSTVTFSFGIATGLFGNSFFVSDLVTKGQLDYYLALPRNVLWHILISRIRPSALGDLVFGPCVFMLFGHPTLERVLVYLSVSLLAAIVQLGFYVMIASLSFFLERSSAIENTAVIALLHFSSYPASIFSGWSQVLLHTLIPAAFITGIPVELVREFRPGLFIELVAAAAIFAALGIYVFNLGLRRYESGNLLMMRE